MNLGQLRNSRGIQRQFAALHLEICGKHLNDIEAGRVNLTDKMALKFSNFYNIDVKKIKEMYREGKYDQFRCNK